MAIVDRLRVPSLPIPLPWWFGFSLSLFLPLLLMVFLLTGPHDAPVALGWIIPLLVLIVLDSVLGDEARSLPSGDLGSFTSFLLLLLAALAPVNLVLSGWFLSNLFLKFQGNLIFLISNLVALRFIAGTTLCCSVIAPAHEMMHRGSGVFRALARCLLLLVFADDFFFAHGGGHHRNLGQKEDPSSATQGENYEAFFQRSLRAQWGMAHRRFPRGFKIGVALQMGLFLVFAGLFGILSALFWTYLCVVSRRLLEAVNYFQHYGLDGASRRHGVLAWRCDGGISYFLFLGLTRHGDHHLRPGVPFIELRPRSGEPHLPLGYLGTAIWVKNHSSSYRRWADQSLSSLRIKT